MNISQNDFWILKRHRKILGTLAFIGLCIAVFIGCMNEQPVSKDPRGELYAGSQKCFHCHENIFDAYKKTAHHLTSSPASKQSIKGSFAKDSNELYYRSELKVEMEKRDSGFYQVAYLNNVERKTVRFDIVMGSGRKGQSYLYWHGDNIYQLPVSYYVPGKCWVNSPGYPPQNVNFIRNIPVGCFECHSSYIKKTATQPVGQNLYDFFDKTQVVYGIDCERCHGPATKHVEYHESNPAEKLPKFITTYASLNRQARVDMCAMCHSGARESVKPSFYYQPGHKLSDYLVADTATTNAAEIDVHGKQYQLLVASKCFQKSKTLTCTSCHNPHVEERDQIASFSKKCMSCHESPAHSISTISAISVADMEKNCIDCHMPTKPSAIITMKSQTQAKQIPALIRTHFISIYPDETKKFGLNTISQK